MEEGEDGCKGAWKMSGVMKMYRREEEEKEGEGQLTARRRENINTRRKRKRMLKETEMKK